jgi:hypothetical protein
MGKMISGPNNLTKGKLKKSLAKYFCSLSLLYLSLAVIVCQNATLPRLPPDAPERQNIFFENSPPVVSSIVPSTEAVQ